MNLQKRAKIDKAGKLYDQFCENIEAAAGTITHGVAWAAKDCLDLDSPDYQDETDEKIDNQVASKLVEEALHQITEAAVILRHISCKQRTNYFRALINAALQFHAFALASKMALIALENNRDREYFTGIYNKYQGRKDEVVKGNFQIDLEKFEIYY